jgi:hypothetical protein
MDIVQKPTERSHFSRKCIQATSSDLLYQWNAFSQSANVLPSQITAVWTWDPPNFSKYIASPHTSNQSSWICVYQVSILQQINHPLNGRNNFLSNNTDSWNTQNLELSLVSCVGLVKTICGHILFAQADTNQLTLVSGATSKTSACCVVTCEANAEQGTRTISMLRHWLKDWCRETKTWNSHSKHKKHSENRQQNEERCADTNILAQYSSSNRATKEFHRDVSKSATSRSTSSHTVMTISQWVTAILLLLFM